jgi:hypothetical protein
MITFALPELINRDGLVDPELLADALIEFARTFEPGDLLESLEGVGAPALDMVVTPMSARAALLGMREGKAFYHHELRRRIPMPPELEPSLQVWDGGTVPMWREGILEEPKYFSFFQEAPLASYNPNHRRKWRAHELLHGAVGFFWRPDITRFEGYLSARINELLPVVHWYGFDEMFRPRCAEHTAEVLYRDGCQACEAAARPFWEYGEWHEQRDAAIAFANTANEHYRREIEMWRAEVETGEVHESPRGRLNASSDAVGYLESHWNRMTAWSFGSWMERFMTVGVDYVDTMWDLDRRVSQTYTDLVQGDLSLDLQDFERLRERRAMQDVAYRLYLAMEWVDPDSAAGRNVEDALEPALEILQASCEGLLGGDSGSTEAVWEHVAQAIDQARPNLPEAVASGLDAFGFQFGDHAISASSVAYATHGLETATPAVFAARDDLDVASFVASPTFGENGLIASRFATWLESVDSDLAELARFEAWTLEPPRRDRAAELFGAVLDDDADLSNARIGNGPVTASDAHRFVEPPTSGELRLNETWRRSTFRGGPLQDVLGLPDADVDLGAYIWRGELRIVIVELEVDAVLEALSRGEVPSDTTAVAGLVAEGALVWLPAAR